jgi:hypothetical protein
LNSVWGEEESNLRRLRQQIYSLPHLTALESPRGGCGCEPACRQAGVSVGVEFEYWVWVWSLCTGCGCDIKFSKNLKTGADGRARTADQLITNQLLYQLSYIGEEGVGAGVGVGVQKNNMSPFAK